MHSSALPMYSSHTATHPTHSRTHWEALQLYLRNTVHALITIVSVSLVSSSSFYSYSFSNLFLHVEYKPAISVVGGQCGRTLAVWVHCRHRVRVPAPCSVLSSKLLLIYCFCCTALGLNMWTSLGYDISTVCQRGYLEARSTTSQMDAGYLWHHDRSHTPTNNSL